MRGPSRRAAARAFVLAMVLLGAAAPWVAAQGLPGDVTPGGTTMDDQLRIAASADSARRATATRSVLGGPVDPEQYRLGPGDVLSLEYAGRATGSRQFVIDSEGRARIPELGVVSLGGRTLAEARADLLRRLRPFLPGARLDLLLLSPRTFKLYVLGEVRAPGVVEVTGSARVLEAIEAAGGAGPLAGTRNVRLVRRSGEAVLADLARFQRTGDLASNPYLEDGDRVIVPVAVSRIGVFGAVAAPGPVEFREGDRLSTAIDLAGGPRPEARLDSVLIVRFRGASTLDTLRADVEAIRAGRAEDVPLAADDRIFVRGRPEWHPAREVAVTGEVRFPGVYAIQEGSDRVSDLIGWAGGFTPDAARSNVRMERRLAPTVPDVEFDRLSRLSRTEMTNSEYQTFRGKLALRQAAYLVDFSSGRPQPAQSDVLLKDGDRIDVARLEMAVRVDGSVRRPGLVVFQEGRSVHDYVKMAGGAAPRADLRDMRLTRSGSGATLFAREVKQVRPGDFIWVPEKKESNFWSVFRDVVVVAGQVATVVLVIHQLNR